MAKRKRVINERVIKRRLKEGRGQGRGADYQPWLRIQDVPSQGLVTHIKGWKTGRCHHFLSKLECQYFYILEWSPIVCDIHEQFPLELSETRAIAESLGVARPTNPRTRQSVVMTTDFVNTINQAGKLTEHARSIKYSQELSSDRMLEKLEIERRYWSERGIDWGLVMRHCSWLLVFLITFASAVVRAQTSRATSAASYVERGDDWVAKGELDRAIADYNLAIATHPGMAIAYHRRGEARGAKGDLVGAIADYTKALEINPRLVEGYNNRGSIRFIQGEIAGALDDLNAAIELAPARAAAYQNRGVVWQHKGDLEGALADFNRAIALDPRFAEAYNCRGTVWSENGDLDRAIADFSRSIKLNPNYYGAFANRGLARLRQGKASEAEKDFGQCLKLNPDLQPRLERQIKEVKQQLGPKRQGLQWE